MFYVQIWKNGELTSECGPFRTNEEATSYASLLTGDVRVDDRRPPLTTEDVLAMDDDWYDA